MKGTVPTVLPGGVSPAIGGRKSVPPLPYLCAIAEIVQRLVERCEVNRIKLCLTRIIRRASPLTQAMLRKSKLPTLKPFLLT